MNFLVLLILLGSLVFLGFLARATVQHYRMSGHDILGTLAALAIILATTGVLTLFIWVIIDTVP